jgi:molybdenum cofactor cytidylyltransferase
MTEVAAILLAAGRSRRMGAFKPLLPFGKSTVIETCVHNLLEGGADEVLVVLGHRADEIERRLDLSNVSFTHNPDPDSEMSLSIACGIRHLHPLVRATLIALSDQPAIPASVVRGLIAQWRKGAKIVKPEYQDRGGHPVLIDLDFRQDLLSLDPSAGLRLFLADHRAEVCRFAVDSPMIARDMDTWDDYISLHKELFGSSPN